MLSEYIRNLEPKELSSTAYMSAAGYIGFMVSGLGNGVYGFMSQNLNSVKGVYMKAYRV